MTAKKTLNPPQTTPVRPPTQPTQAKVAPLYETGRRGPKRARPETLGQMHSNQGLQGQWVCALYFLLVFEGFMFVKFHLTFNAVVCFFLV